jgi:hypothetical protein
MDKLTNFVVGIIFVGTGVGVIWSIVKYIQLLTDKLSIAAPTMIGISFGLIIVGIKIIYDS